MMNNQGEEYPMQEGCRASEGDTWVACGHTSAAHAVWPLTAHKLAPFVDAFMQTDHFACTYEIAGLGSKLSKCFYMTMLDFLKESFSPFHVTFLSIEV